MRVPAAVAIAVVLTLPAYGAERKSRIEPKPPPLASRLSWPASYATNLPLCIGGSALLKMTVVERKLTNGEIWRLLGSCALPLVGGYLVERTFGKSKAWNEYPIDIAGPGVPAWRRRD
jgi:hypothetical protein